MSEYVLPSVDCESDNSKIVTLSNNIIKKYAKKRGKSVSKLTDKEKANAILYYVQDHFEYGDYSNTHYGALTSLNEKNINCVDSTHVTVALLRAANIPAKYESKMIGDDGHCWPCVYLNKKWLAGEATAGDNGFFPRFGECQWLNDNWVKPMAKPGTYINSSNFNIKQIKYDNQWVDYIECHIIDNNIIYYYQEEVYS